MEPHWKSILPVDRYVVRLNGLLHEYDRKVLTLLYQPLIGATAYSLYMTLWSVLEQDTFWGKEATHHSLMTITGLHLQQIYQERKKLEGIGLLQTFLKEGEDARTYLYELQPPPTPGQFFNDGVLNVYLYNRIGKKRFNALKRYFSYEKMDDTDFKPVTASFNDVYDSVHPSELVASDHSEMGAALQPEDKKEWVSRNDSDDVTISDSDFDFDLMMTHLSNLIVPKEAITEDLKEIIGKLAFIYKIEPLEMSKRIERAYIQRDKIEKEELRKEVQDWYLFEHEDRFPTLVFRYQPLQYQTQNDKEPSDDEGKIVQAFETYSPAELLEEMAGGAKPALSDLKVIEGIMFEQKLPAGVVNVLIDYVMSINDKKLNKNHVEKIAGHWARKKVKTAREAMQLARTEHKKYQDWVQQKNRSSRTPNKNARKAPLPKWMDKKDKKQELPDAEWKQLRKQLDDELQVFKKNK
jgi:replication initiation and membrane attachment protein